MSRKAFRPEFRVAVIVLLLTGAALLSRGHAQDAPPKKPGGAPGKTALSEDTSIGSIADREGAASLKPVMHDRWTVAQENMPLETGDWLKTGTRGANALYVRLNSGAKLILGPGALVELTDPKSLKLLRGECEVAVPEKLSVKVIGPKEAALSVTGTRVLRAREDKLTTLEKEPRWLTGYKSNQSTEAMGSLLANVEGRNVPLTIGYHKVTVDIRDQIARTMVEESFVNHTNHVLEGVFYFPLPQDASISGFAMWIGDEMVEADIVEKQRAREIYETILREKRDPGLLEWTGGNIFKARVYPIGTEKRIRITYTQVLPKTGGTYRYNYSLQSEMLTKHPLRQLQIEVKLNSAEPLTSVECLSHTCRIDTTRHSAHVEFDAEEYTPTRDFELRVAAGMPKNNIAMIPHRRGRDGYLLLLVNAPGQKEKSTRPTLTNTKPLNLIVMADTSGSMSGPQRETQLCFIEALLGSLSQHDTFNIVTCDTQARWMSQKPLANTEGNRESALPFIEKRYPLGWSDLDKAFESVIENITAGTHVVYVGDGIVTTGDADPVAFTKRLQRMYRGAGTFHAVAPGSSYESVVLQAIAGLGGGSTREIGGGTDPAQTAFALLKEISSPVVRDLEVTFSGVSVAALYPETLPNLPAGTQQIIIGRYDPAHGDQKACVTISGTLAGKKIEYTREVTLAGAETGNSFIPRLWARKHLDYLLAQGATAKIKNRIITLSEDFQIMTPYTSFLVLESDEDRKRFNVKRRFRMRDAEEFFAEGRDRADYELTRKQMLKAKRWRLQLQAQILETLADMERDATNLLRPPVTPYLRAGFTGRSVSGTYSISDIDFAGMRRGKPHYARGYAGAGAPAEMEKSARFKGDATPPPEQASMPTEPEPAGEEFYESPPEEAPQEEDREALQKEAQFAAKPPPPMPRRRARFDRKEKKSELRRTISSREEIHGKKGREAANELRALQPYDQLRWLFPPVPAPPGKRPEPGWPEEILKLISALNRRQVVAGVEGALQFRLTSRYTDHRGRITSRYRSKHLLSKDAWLTFSSQAPGGDFSVNWCYGNERGVVKMAWQLGRIRDKQEGDEKGWSQPFSHYFGTTLRSYGGYTPEMKRLEDGRVELTLRHPSNPKGAVVLIIDPEKAAVIEQRGVSDGKITSSTIYSDFVEVADAWWPRLVTTKDKDGRVTGTVRISVKLLARERFDRTVTGTLAVRKRRAIILTKEPESIAAAKQAVKDGNATLDDRWLLLRYFAASQQWDKAQPHLQAICDMAAGKWGLNLIRMALLQASRRNEEIKTLLMEVAAQLAQKARLTDLACANQLVSYSHSLNQGNERLELLKKLKPVYERRKTGLDPMLYYHQQVMYCLQRMGRRDEAFAKAREMAGNYPFNYSVQTSYASQLAGRGEVDAAVAHLTQAEKKNGPWREHEIQSFRSTCANILWNAYRLESFVDYIETWEREQPGKVGQHSLNQYLSALIMLDREAKAWELIKDWLTSTRKEKLRTTDRNRLGAAIQHALGRGYNMYRYRYEVPGARLLAETARYFADHETEHRFAGQILQDHNFARTDECSSVKLELYTRLKSEVITMPAGKIQRFFGWLKYGSFKTDEGEEGWQKILDGVYSRWEEEKDSRAEQVLAGLILRYGRRELKLRYYRKLLAAAQTPTEKVYAAGCLFDALLTGEWSQALQDEILGVLAVIATKVDDNQAQADVAVDRAIVAFYRLTSWLVRSCARSTVNALPDVNEMPRRKLRAAWREALREARSETVELYSELEKNFRPSEVRPWIALERIYLQVLLGSDRQKIRNETMALLTPVLASSAGKEVTEIKTRDLVLTARCVATLTYLCTLEPDAEDAIKELLTLMDSQLADGNQALDWKTAKYMCLVALDMGDELEAALKDWYGEGTKFAKIQWGRDYAYILAERNDIAGAIKVFEEIERIDELGFADYRTLADWYMVQDARIQRREAMIKSWQTLQEYQISNSISRQSHKYQRRGKNVPSELDAEIPLMFIALMRKARYPRNHLYLLQSFYQTTKDFRLLECVPEAVIGQSSQKIYPVLEQFTRITNLIMDEATIDRLEKHLVSLHPSVKETETDMDRRALYLLEFMVERRATEQSHGIGPHADAALRALKQAYKGEWAHGEPEMMAAFLANQGNLRPEALAREQLRQLGALHANAQPGSYARFVIAGHYARTQWVHGRRDEATATLGGAINEFRQANGGLLPRSANNLLRDYCSYLQNVGDFAAAEKVWLGELEQGHNAQQIYWLKQQLYNHYHSTLSSRAEVSLGAGPELYRAVCDLILSELQNRTNENQARTTISILCSIWYVCHKNLRYSEVREDITEFAFNTLPKVLNMYNYRNGQSAVSTVADRLRDIAGPLTALRFLVVRAETEPRWLRLANQDFWSHHGWRFARLRSEAAPLDNRLKARVLSIVLSELREDLRTRRSRGQSIYHIHNSYFWSEKKNDFARTAHEMLAEFADSEQTVIYIARYFYHGLNLYNDAIDALYAAHSKNILGIEGQHQLCKYLQEQKRYGESVVLLVKMIEKKPDRLEFRTMLMRGYFHAGEERLLRATLTAAHAHFHEIGQWYEGNIAALGAACLETQLFEQCVKYYKEAIALHVKRAPRRGVGDGTLSQYYNNMSGAYSGSGLTAEAVDAAAGAIIAWGPDKYQRQRALNRLENVLRNAADLDAYVGKLDTQVAETGLENPIVRKALGKVYFQKRDYEKARTQLRLAIESQPNDMETHRLLVEVYDRQRKPERAVVQLLESARLSGHDIRLYRDLGDRLTRMGNSEEAQRAYTNMVEMLPNESESHACLAQIRQKQERWEEAQVQWRQVIRVRTEEPAGYLGLARALLKLHKWDEALKVTRHLLRTDWPARFGDVHSQARQIERQMK